MIAEAGLMNFMLGAGITIIELKGCTYDLLYLKKFILLLLSKYRHSSSESIGG